MNNPKISDAVACTNTTVVGSAPSVAVANLYHTLSFATGLMAMNAVAAQQQANLQHQAVTVEGVRLLYSLIKP